VKITLPNHVKSRKEYSPESPGGLISLMLLLAACGPVLAFTPERAVVQDLLASNAGQIIPDSILNAAQEVIFSFDMAEPAPGKQDPQIRMDKPCEGFS
jgi:hypothetical protein